jgi:DNA-binding MarR family transcriptional regulator
MLSVLSENPDQRLLALVHRTSAAGRALRRLLAEEAQAAGLSDAELLVVWLCDDQGPGLATSELAQVELALAVGVSPAQMSGTVERLRQRGLLETHRATVDRRRQVWRTTAEGRAALASIQPGITRIAARIDELIAPAEQRTLCAACERLAEAASGDARTTTERGSAGASPSHVNRPPVTGAAA